jgi:putative hemolysin
MARWLLNCRTVWGHPWRVGLATEPREREAIFRLRYEVFVVEQGYGHVATDAGPGLDMDHFDTWCDQLFLYDEAKGCVAGTYRALRGSEALRRGGFYAGDEFDLSPLAPIAHQILQGGRLCIAAEYRSSMAFQYLSYGMELLLRAYDCRYLMGADSFRANRDTLSRVHSYLMKHHKDPEWFVMPWEANRAEELREVETTPSDEKLLPEIIRMDLKLGFKVCSPPALDAGFGCYDFMMLGRRDRFSPLYYRVLERMEKRVSASGQLTSGTPCNE